MKCSCDDAVGAVIRVLDVVCWWLLQSEIVSKVLVLQQQQKEAAAQQEIMNTQFLVAVNEFTPRILQAKYVFSCGAKAQLRTTPPHS
jgi:hypothetical protein